MSDCHCPDDETCDHDDFDIDLLEGRCTCGACGYRGYLTAAQLDRYISAMFAEPPLRAPIGDESDKPVTDDIGEE